MTTITEKGFETTPSRFRQLGVLADVTRLVGYIASLPHAAAGGPPERARTLLRPLRDMHVALADEGMHVLPLTDGRWTVTSILSGAPGTAMAPADLYDDEHVGATPADAARRHAAAWNLDPGTGDWPNHEADARPPHLFLAVDCGLAADLEAAGARVEHDLTGLAVWAVPDDCSDVGDQPTLREAIGVRRMRKGAIPSRDPSGVRPAGPDRISGITKRW